MSTRMIRTGFLLDVRRIFKRRASTNLKGLICENLLMPILVAVVVGLAFLCRKGFDEFKLNFIYFSTLYAFWIGMFGSCQTFNGEVQNGEWSYWVLGLGRNRTFHFLSAFAVNLVFSFLQTLVFIVAIVCFSSAMGGHFTELFITTKSSYASPVFQMDGMLSLVLQHQFGPHGPLLGAIGIFSLAMFSAALSGIGFGLLFSALFKDPSISLNLSVGFVVLLGMLSLSALDGSGNLEEGDQVEDGFRPRLELELAKTPEDCQIGHKVKTLVAVSKFLPQRYFFNLGRLYQKRSLGEEELTHLKDSVVQDFLNNNQNKRPRWLKSIKGTSSTNVECAGGLQPWLSKNTNAVQYFQDRPSYKENKVLAFLETLDKYPEVLESFALPEHRALMRKAIRKEEQYILLIFCCCMLLTVILIHNKGIYDELR